MSSPFTVAPPNLTANPPDFHFQNTYARLPERFHARVNPVPVKSPRLIKLNERLARSLNLDPEALATPEGVAILAGNRVASGSEPLAIAYAGHQFGHFVPRLGDGRANLLGEVVAQDGARYDIQLKGSGRTPFSRGGDGRAVIGPVLREYLLSEAMAALGVPTTRALAAVTTGESVLRETLLPGAVFTRVAASHLRVGTFQYFAAQGDTEGLGILARYAIARHDPEAVGAPKPIRALLDGGIARHARLVAQWMCLGFIHGVMNTDNTSISGETIDYGPCAFMESYDPRTVFSSIDRNGRYAYSNQPHAAHWNLARLAEALLPLLAQEEGSEPAAIEAAQEALGAFGPQFEVARLAGLRQKLGLLTEREGDAALSEDLLERMAANHADFTLTFRRLSDAAESSQPAESMRSPGFATATARIGALFTDPAAFETWGSAWRIRLAEEFVSAQDRAAAMRHANPTFIPRNHLVQAAIAAAELNNFQPFEDLVEVTSQPYEDQPGREPYAQPATPDQYVHHTFCGT